jgi:hypothetical protein
MPARWLTNGVTTPGRHDSGPRAILTGISRVWAEKLDVPVKRYAGQMEQARILVQVLRRQN